MNKFTAIAAVVAMSSMAHAAGDATEFKWDAEMRTRFFSQENMGIPTASNQSAGAAAPNNLKNTQNNFWRQRNALGLTLTKGESITGRVRMINSMRWGALTGGSTDNTAQPTQTNTNNLLYVNEAWMGWAINSNITMKAGRMALATVADGSVLSTNDWLENPYSSDGVQFIFDYDFGRIGVMGVKATDLQTAGTAPLSSDPETNFYGISFDAKNLPEWLKIANFHVIQQNRDQSGTVTSTNVNTLFTTDAANIGLNVMRYGITLGGDVSGVDYGITYAGHQGKVITKGLVVGSAKDDVNWNSTMLDAKVGYTLADMMGLRIGVGYHQDGGQDNSTDSLTGYQPFFYERHANAGRMDLIGWGNLTSTTVNVAFSPMENTKVGVEYWMFSRTKTETASAAYRETQGSSNTNNTIGTASATNKDANIGTEIDVYATHQYDNGLSLTGRFGQFTAGDFLKNGGVSVDDVRQFMLEGRMMF